MRADPQLVSANAWVKRWAVRMRTQTARRASLPPGYANGAVEGPIKRVRRALEKRSWTFRNRVRMQQLLELIRLAALRVDDSGEYAKGIRAHLLKHKGRPSRTYRAVYDTWGKKGQQTRVYSLRPSDAQVQTRAANNAARKAGAVPKPKPPAAKPAATPSTGRRATRTPRSTPP